MAAAYNQVIIHYRDESGKECQTFWSTVDQGAGGASAYTGLAAAAQAISDCAVIAVQFQTTVLIEATPTSGPYNTVTDRAMILSKIGSTGKPLTLQFVGPKASIFQSDTLKLDLTNADVIALEALMMSLIGDVQGHAMGPIRKGYREQARGTP